MPALDRFLPVSWSEQASNRSSQALLKRQGANECCLKLDGKYVSELAKSTQRLNNASSIDRGRPCSSRPPPAVLSDIPSRHSHQIN